MFQFVETRPYFLLCVSMKDWLWKHLRERWQEWSSAWVPYEKQRRLGSFTLQVNKASRHDKRREDNKWSGEGNTGLSLSLDLTHWGQRRKIKQPPQIWNQIQWDTFFTWQEGCGTHCPDGLGARNPLVFNKASTRLIPKPRRLKATPHNYLERNKKTRLPQFYNEPLIPKDRTETLIIFLSTIAFPVSFPGTSAPTTYN